MDCLNNKEVSEAGQTRLSQGDSNSLTILELPLNSNAKLHAVNGVVVRSCRKELGWSQVELGIRAGYSERVIRKAEAGGTLRFQTIKDLAMTLSLGGAIVSFHDLTNATTDRCISEVHAEVMLATVEI